MQIPWWGYVILAGLSWGTYVPIIFFGGSELSAKPGIGGRLMAIVCVGVAYLVLAIVIPVVVFLVNRSAWADVNSGNTGGYVFAGLAGVMGAVGAICVVFASNEAMSQGRAEFDAERQALVAVRDGAPEKEREEMTAQIESLDKEADARKAKYRILIAPLIFSIAPIVNTLLASFWAPGENRKGWANFEWSSPHWLFWVGILLVAVGTGCVLYAKELGEQERKKKHQTTAKVTVAPLTKLS